MPGILARQKAVRKKAEGEVTAKAEEACKRLQLNSAKESIARDFDLLFARISWRSRSSRLSERAFDFFSLFRISSFKSPLSSSRRLLESSRGSSSTPTRDYALRRARLSSSHCSRCEMWRRKRSESAPSIGGRLSSPSVWCDMPRVIHDQTADPLFARLRDRCKPPVLAS